MLSCLINFMSNGVRCEKGGNELQPACMSCCAPSPNLSPDICEILLLCHTQAVFGFFPSLHAIIKEYFDSPCHDSSGGCVRLKWSNPQTKRNMLGRKRRFPHPRGHQAEHQALTRHMREHRPQQQFLVFNTRLNRKARERRRHGYRKQGTDRFPGF